MAKILAPNKKYNGESASVKFVDGVGYTEDKNLITWFKEKGYGVEKGKAPAEEPTSTPVEEAPVEEPKKTTKK